MKAILSTFFIGIMILVLVFMGAKSLRESIAAEIEEVGIALEDRKLNKRIMSKLKSAASGDFRRIVMDVFLMDVSLLKEWLETKSSLSEEQKRRQIRECKETLENKKNHYSTMFQGMSDEEILKLVKSHISDHDSAWRRRLLSLLET